MLVYKINLTHQFLKKMANQKTRRPHSLTSQVFIIIKQKKKEKKRVGTWEHDEKLSLAAQSAQ